MVLGLGKRWIESHITGWFNHIAPNLLCIQCPRRFLEMDPEKNGTRVLYTPANPVPIFFFSPARYVFLYFLGYLGLRRFKNSGKKRKPFVDCLAGTHITRVRTIRNYLRKTA